MRIQTRIPYRPHYRYILLIRDKQPRFGILIRPTQTKVNHEQLAGLVINTHDKVLGLDVAIDVALWVQELYLLEDLNGEEEGGLDGELAATEGHQVLQIGA